MAVAVLLISALGPMLDHHFAERHPAHGHLYLGLADHGHAHPFEESHVHNDAMYAPVPGGAGVVFFSRHDASAHSHADFAASVAPSLPLFGEPYDPLLKNGLENEADLRGIAPAPLKQPPRA